MKRRRIQITTNREVLAASFSEVASSGIITGIVKEGENLHLTYCMDLGGCWNCHIKFNGETLWQERKAPKELIGDIIESIRDSTVSWKNKDYVLAIDPKLFKKIEEYISRKESESSLNIIDFSKELIPLFRKNLLIRRKLGNMRKDEVIIGIPEHYENSLILALPDHVAILFSLNYDEGILGAILPIQGIIRFVEYADKLGFLDSGIDEESRKDVEHALIELGFEL